MDSSALAHLDSVVSSTDGPAIEAWPAKSDGDPSEDLITHTGRRGFPFGIHCRCHRATLWTHLRGLGRG